MHYAASRCAGFAVALLAAALTAGSGNARGDESIVIVLGDLQVARPALERRFDIAVRLLAARQGVSLLQQDYTVIEGLRQQYLDKYATELVLLQEARRRQLSVDERQVDAAVEEALADNAEMQAIIAGIPGEETSGSDELRQVLRDEMLIALVTEQMLKEIRIPAGDVITLHHDVKDKLATPEEVCVRHIQLDSVELAEQVLAELSSGADFAALAAARSTDAATAAAGGDLGCFERGSRGGRTAFERAAFAATEGRVTGPVESPLGHHVLLVYEHRMPRAPTLNEAYAQIERELALEQLPQRIQALVTRSGIEVFPENFE